MTNFRILRPPALLLATVAKAAVIVAPLENETSITKVARAAARADNQRAFVALHTRAK